MTRRALAALSLIAAIGTASAALAFVRVWQQARPVTCNVYAMPSEVVGKCFEWLGLMGWGVE